MDRTSYHNVTACDEYKLGEYCSPATKLSVLEHTRECMVNLHAWPLQTRSVLTTVAPRKFHLIKSTSNYQGTNTCYTVFSNP